MSEHETEPPESDDNEIVVDTSKPHVCPECGAEYKLAMHLGLHRRREHGVQGSAKQSSPKRKRTSSGGGRDSTQTRRRKAISETLLELVTFSDDLRGQSVIDTSSLADVIRRDADRIADAIAAWAEKAPPVGALIDIIAHGLVVKTFRGFQGLARLAVNRSRLRKQQQAEQDGWENVGLTEEQAEYERGFGVPQ